MNKWNARVPGTIINFSLIDAPKDPVKKLKLDKLGVLIPVFVHLQNADLLLTLPIGLVNTVHLPAFFGLTLKCSVKRGEIATQE